MLTVLVEKLSQQKLPCPLQQIALQPSVRKGTKSKNAPRDAAVGDVLQNADVHARCSDHQSLQLIAQLGKAWVLIK